MINRPRVDPTQVAAGQKFAKIVQLAILAIVASLAIGATIGGEIGKTLSLAGIGLLSAMPFVRVIWLTFRWKNQHDIKFAVAGTALILLAIFGTLFSYLT